jgi:class 3 adenylate cyclase
VKYPILLIFSVDIASSFSACDLIPVETIGDSYMCVAGCPDNSNDAVDDASRLCRFAFDIIRTVKNFQPSYLPDGVRIEIRVGMHSGSVVAGVVGRAMPVCL